MYAVFATGGKQYRATTGDILKIEKLDADKGATVELDQVLLVGEGEDIKVGSPYLEGGKVTVTIVEHGRGDKIRILKFKRRKQYMKRMGHRQDFTRIEITGIAASVPKKKVSEAKAPETKAPEAKVSKTRVSKTRVSKARVSKAKASKAKASKAKVSKAKVSKAKVSKAKVSKAKVSKPEAGAPEAESED
jgi:large subunit ribosomal protein L21